ncbi:MAG: LLM class flavin-dependent oxidoreductase [Thaumarchaeota archaeon]|nr:LLM class flavin-dependent oxidoreductase [Nitrososphaerota archaeon]
MKLAVGLSIPVGAQPLANTIRVAQLTEQLGFDSFFMHENPMYGDALIAAYAVMKATSRIRVCAGVVSVVTRHPVMTAVSALTLQNEGGGRFILGLGLGGFPWLPLIGVDVQPVGVTKPLRRMVEAVNVIRALTSGEPAVVEGTFYRVKGFRSAVRPSSHIPIYIASLGRKTLSYAPKVADGVITSPGVLTPEQIEAMVSWVRMGEEKHGRRVKKVGYLLCCVASNDCEAYYAIKRDPFFIYQLSEVVGESSLVDYGVDTTPLPEIRDAWRRRDLGRAAELVSDEMVQVLTASGTPENALRRLEEYSGTGLDLLVLSPVGDPNFCLRTFASAITDE